MLTILNCLEPRAGSTLYFLDIVVITRVSLLSLFYPSQPYLLIFSRYSRLLSLFYPSQPYLLIFSRYSRYYKGFSTFFILSVLTIYSHIS